MAKLLRKSSDLTTNMFACVYVHVCEGERTRGLDRSLRGVSAGVQTSLNAKQLQFLNLSKSLCVHTYTSRPVFQPSHIVFTRQPSP